MQLPLLVAGSRVDALGAAIATTGAIELVGLRIEQRIGGVEHGELDTATQALLASFERRPGSAATPDGLSLTP